jgi:Zn-dependent protease with chaperone function
MKRGERPAFFAFAQQSAWIGGLAFLAWLAAARAYLFDALIGLDLSVGLALPAAAMTFLGPPILVSSLLGLMVHHVARRADMTDWSWRDAIGDTLLTLVGVLSPIVLIASAIDAAWVRLYLEATIATVAAVLVGAAAKRAGARASGLTPHAVSSGELRDRVFGLAERAGVKLQQLYVVPLRRFRLANAFAVSGNTVVLTDVLLRELDRDEVDAILAHEMAHLARRDPERLAWIMIMAIAIPACAALAGNVAAAAVALAVCVPAQLAFRRRFEYATDARALTLGVRAESSVTGLVRLHRLSQVPLRWSRLHELLLTHPSLDRRSLAIAKRAGLDPHTVASWLDSPPPAGTRYAIPPTVSAPREFGSEFRRRVSTTLLWTLLGAAALVPAAMVAAMGQEGPIPRLLGVAIATLGGSAAWVSLWAFGSAMPMRALARSLAKRLGVQANEDRVFVGLAPGLGARLYEGFSEWDAGFVGMRGGSLEYVGEEASFSLAPDEVRDVRVGVALPGWLPLRAVRVRWERADGTSGDFGLIPLGSHAFRAGAEAGGLLAAIEAWRGATLREAPPARPLGPPPTMAITSIAPGEALKPAAIFTTLVVIFVMSLGAAFLFRLPLAPSARGWIDAGVASALAYLVAVAPLLVWREPAQPARDAEDERKAA